MAVTTITPKLVSELVFTEGPKTVTIKEGDLLTELKYMSGGSEITTSGVVNVINFNYVRPTTQPACIHDTTSTFATAVTPTSLIVDCSTEYDSDVREVPISAITAVTAQENTDQGEESGTV